MTVTAATRLRVEHVSKTFDATIALDDVSFAVAAGQVHAFLGANGAGKSTLIKIMAGLHTPDSGGVFVDGGAARDSISFIHQDLALVDTMTVEESVAITRPFPRRAGLINWSAVRSMASHALGVLGAEIPGDALIGDLSRADRSIVAIARAITDKCKVLVLDEPTASLPDAEVRRLFVIIRSLCDRGVSVLYVTHRLDEVFEIADCATVLRDGRVVASGALLEFTRDDLIRIIAGRDLAAQARSGPPANRQTVMRFNGIQLSERGPAIRELELAAGELLGLAGLRGDGQELLGRGIAGVEPLNFDTGLIDGVECNTTNAQTRLKKRVGFASSRRETEGLAVTLTSRENLFMNPGVRGRRPLACLSQRVELADAVRVGDSVRLNPNEPEKIVGTFSGGNQQKVILGRWLAADVAVLVLEEPTMGIDVGARADIYELIASAAGRGLSVVIVSSDFEELALLCHRVLVLRRAAIIAELRDCEVTLDDITRHVAGGETPEVVHHVD